jgi:lipopolysaccharide heptosyltransferase II
MGKTDDLKKILVANVNWLGDAILTTPVFKALKEKFPSSFIASMGAERIQDVFRDNPYIDEHIVFDEKGSQKGLIAKMQFIRQLQAKRFDTVFLIHRSFTRALVCCLAGIKERIGYQRLKNALVLTRKIQPPSRNIHRQQYYLSLFEECGIGISDKHPRVFLTPGVRAAAETRLKPARESGQHLVGMHVSANWPLKQWPEESFAALADALSDQMNATIVFTGSDKNVPKVKRVMQRMTHKAYDFCGSTTLKELAAFTEKMSLFVSNDSGPAHLAASFDTPTLVLFGPTSEKITTPLGKDVTTLRAYTDCKIPCYRLDCNDNRCMKDITVHQVYEQAIKLLRHDRDNH